MQEFELRFLQAHIARNAPLLDVPQVAALQQTTPERLARHLYYAKDDERAEFAIWLTEQNHEMDLYLRLRAVRVSPAIVEFKAELMKIAARSSAPGEHLAMPEPSRQKAASVEEATRRVFPPSL